MDVSFILKTKKDLIISLAKKHGAYNVRVFGSASRNESGEKSDLDLLVQMEEGRSQLDLIGLWQDLEEALGCKVDVITEGGISPYLRDKIHQEAKAL